MAKVEAARASEIAIEREEGGWETTSLSSLFSLPLSLSLVCSGCVRVVTAESLASEQPPAGTHANEPQAQAQIQAEHTGNSRNHDLASSA